MCPTDVCHPNELRAPAPRAFPVRSRSFRCVDTPRSLRLRTVLPGDRTFHDVRDRFGGSSSSTFLDSRALRLFRVRAWAFSSHGTEAIEPLTPLSRYPFTPTPHVLSLVLPLGRAFLFWRISYGSESAETA
jgi:hypothetical protein